MTCAWDSSKGIRKPPQRQPYAGLTETPHADPWAAKVMSSMPSPQVSGMSHMEWKIHLKRPQRMCQVCHPHLVTFSHLTWWSKIEQRSSVWWTPHRPKVYYGAAALGVGMYRTHTVNQAVYTTHMYIRTCGFICHIRERNVANKIICNGLAYVPPSEEMLQLNFHRSQRCWLNQVAGHCSVI